MKRFYYFLFVVACFFFSCGPEEEPKVLGSVYGTVSDKTTGKPIQEAMVELTPGGLQKRTGSNGKYEFFEVEAGTYDLYVTKSGYESFEKKGIVVQGNSKDKPVDIQLEKLPPALTIVDDKRNVIDSIDFGFDETTQKSFGIFNDSEEDLDWNIVPSECAWIKSFSKDAGILKPNQTQSVVCTINRNKLSIGKNSTIVHIVSNNGSKELKVIATSVEVIETLDISEEEIGSHSAVFHGRVVRNLDPTITEYGFVYSTKETPTLTNGARKVSNFGSPQIGTYEMQANDLEKETIYYVRAFVTNGDKTYYGNQITFHTISHVPDIIIHNTYDYEQPISTISTVTLLYSVTDDGGLPIEEVGICWDVNRMPTKENNYLKTGDTKETRKKVTISNLSRGTTYYFRAYVKNSEEENYSTEISVETGSGIPSVELSALTATATTASATIKVLDADGAELQSCGILWSDNPNTITEGHKVEAGGTQEHKAYVCDISGLTPSTTYYICAYATTNVTTRNSTIYYFTTDKGGPEVTTLKIESKGTDFLVVAGSSKTTSDAPITRQGICWSTIPYPSIDDNVVEASVNVSTFSCRIEGLQSGTTYYVRAFAENRYDTVYGEQLSPTTAYDPTILDGYVYDQDGKPVSGVSVAGIYDMTGYNTITDNTGYYSMSLGEQTSGEYSFKVSASNYKEQIENVTITQGQSNQHNFVITLKNKYAVDFGTGLYVNPGEKWEMYFECAQTHLPGQTTTRNMRIKNYRSVPVTWSITNIPTTGITFSKSSGTIPAQSEVSITVTFRYPSTSSYMVSLPGCSDGSKTYIWNWDAAYGGYYISNGSAIPSVCNACCLQNPIITVDVDSEAFTLLFNQLVVWN